MNKKKKEMMSIGIACLLVGSALYPIHNASKETDKTLLSSSQIVSSAAEAKADCIALSDSINSIDEELDMTKDATDDVKQKRVQLASRGAITRGRVVKMMAEITAYNPYNLNVSSQTGLACDGQPATAYHTVSVDPDVIPLGSTVSIPGWGTGLAHDTGSAIVGNKLDIAVESDAAAYAWGRRYVEITVVIPE